MRDKGSSTDGPLKKFGMAVLGLFSFIYLLNPGAGIFELLPDNLPIIGNLDEAAAVAMLLTCLKYFGIDLGRLLRRLLSPDKR